MSPDETIAEIAHQIAGALEVLVDLLRDGIEEVHDNLVGRGLDPDEDPALFYNSVRRQMREGLKPMFPDLAQSNGNMSPVHVPLGPHRLRVLHAKDGSLPQPQTQTREEFYRHNDQGVLALNVYAPDSLVAIDEDDLEVEEATLVLIWDSVGAKLTQATLCRPSMNRWPGEMGFPPLTGHIGYAACSSVRR